MEKAQKAIGLILALLRRTANSKLVVVNPLKKSKRKYPKCVPRSKARSMSKSQIKSAVSRKRAKAQGVGGKPTNVKTFVSKKPKKMENGGAVAAEMQPRKRKVNRQPKDGMIARGCGAVLDRRRKNTKLR